MRQYLYCCSTNLTWVVWNEWMEQYFIGCKYMYAHMHASLDPFKVVFSLFWMCITSCWLFLPWIRFIWSEKHHLRFHSDNDWYDISLLAICFTRTHTHTYECKCKAITLFVNLHTIFIITWMTSESSEQSLNNDQNEIKFNEMRDVRMNEGDSDRVRRSVRKLLQRLLLLFYCYLISLLSNWQ